MQNAGIRPGKNIPVTGDLAGIGVSPLRERRGGIVSIHLRMHSQHPA